jgi:hypothetical protein
MWVAISDERTDLSFVIDVGPHQRSHSLVRVPRGSLSYFTVLDPELPFLSLPTTRRATMDVLDPASTRDQILQLSSLYTSARMAHEAPLAKILLLRHAAVAWIA